MHFEHFLVYDSIKSVQEPVSQFAISVEQILHKKFPAYEASLNSPVEQLSTQLP